MSETTIFPCPYCTENDYTAPTKVLLLDHIRLVHSVDPGFSIRCDVDGCCRSFKNFRTYQNHQLTHLTHQPEVPENDADASGAGDVDNSLVGRPEPLNDHMNESAQPEAQPDIKEFAAKWILKISETKCLTRAATLSIISDVSDLLECVLSSLKCKIHNANATGSLTASKIDNIFSSQLSKPFEGLDSFHQ